jgi:hypothetical protein
LLSLPTKDEVIMTGSEGSFGKRFKSPMRIWTLTAIWTWLQNLVTFAHAFGCILMPLNVRQALEIVRWQAFIVRLSRWQPRTHVSFIGVTGKKRGDHDLF